MNYHEANHPQLSQLDRMLRGEFNDELDATGVGSAIALEAKENIVAGKKQAGEQKQLDGMEDLTPPELIDMAKLYKKEQLAEARAKEKTKATKGAIIQKMKEMKITRFRVEVDGNMKWLTLEELEVIRWEKSETAPKDD